MEILGIIPARGGSKGIPKKNIIDVCGKPLVEYTYNAAKGCALLNRIVLSTDSIEIAKTANSKEIEVMMRPKELAQDLSTTADVISHILAELKEKEKYEPDIVVILQPTSPLREAEDIQKALELLIENSDVDSVVSVQEVPHNYIPEKIMFLNDGQLVPYIKDSQRYTTRQTLPQYYGRNGAAIYAFRTEVFLKTNSYYGDKCLPYVMPPEKSIDVDTPFELKLVRFLLGERDET